MEKQEECFDEECGYDLMVWVETTKSFDEFEFSLAQIIAPVQIDMGYFDLELSYRNVVRVGSTLKALKAVASDPSTEALHDEVDFAEPGGWGIVFCSGRIAKSLLCSRSWGSGWFREKPESLEEAMFS